VPPDRDGDDERGADRGETGAVTAVGGIEVAGAAAQATGGGPDTAAKEQPQPPGQPVERADQPREQTGTALRCPLLGLPSAAGPGGCLAARGRLARRMMCRLT
jgi:hypothetical protein